MLRIPVLQKCMERLSGSLADITQEHFEKLRDLFELQTGRRIDLPYRLAAERTYEGIRLFMKKESEKEAPLHVTGAGIYHFGGRTVEICIEEWDKDKIFPIKTYTKCFDYDKIKDSIFLRTRQRGDYLTVNKEGGRKLLQDYFVNEKVPKEKRDDVLLLADGSHILWVVGKRISEYYKVTEETKRVLKVRSDGGDEYGLQGE